MRTPIAVAFVLCLLVTANLFAGYSRAQELHVPTAEELAMKSVAVAPGASAAVLDWVRVDDHVNGSMSEYVRMKIFSDEGKKYAEVEVPYFATWPYLGRVEAIEARTIHPDGTIIPFDGQVFDKVLASVGRDILRAKTFTFRDVQPGSILEYHYQIRWEREVLPNAHWLLQRSLPVAHLKFTLHAYAASEGALSSDNNDFGAYFTYAGLPPGTAPKRLGKHDYEVELAGIAPFLQEEFAPPDEQLKPHVDFYYTRSKIPPTQFWPMQAQVWTKNAGAFIGSARAVGSSGARLRAGVPNATEGLHKLYTFVQSLKNYSVMSSPGDRQAAKSADDVLARGGGSANELTQTFVAFARAAGLPADALRVASRDRNFFSSAVPDESQMSSEVAVVTIDGKPLYLDPATPGAPFGVVAWEKTNVPAIRLSPGEGQMTKTPAAPPSSALTTRKADLRVDGDTLKGTLTISFAGQEALVRRPSSQDETGRKKLIDDEVRGWFPNGSVLKATSVQGINSSDDAIVLVYDAELPGLVSHAGGSMLMIPVSIFSASKKNPFAASTRTHPIYFPYSRQENDEVRLTLPASMKIEALPSQDDLNAGAFKCRTEVVSHEHDLTYRRSLIIDAMLIEAKYYGPVQKFFNAASEADRRAVLIKPGA
jgi:hypothetical protein